jgi:hypothetical protein
MRVDQAKPTSGAASKGPVLRDIGMPESGGCGNSLTSANKLPAVLPPGFASQLHPALLASISLVLCTASVGGGRRRRGSAKSGFAFRYPTQVQTVQRLLTNSTLTIGSLFRIQ